MFDSTTKARQAPRIPTLVRVGWIVLTLLGGSGILLNLVMWLVTPKAA